MTGVSIGCASRTINNDLGTDIQAATHRRKVRSVRDDLEANALYLKGAEQELLLISCDLVGLDLAYAVGARETVAGACGVPAESILIGCTHTHSGPAILGPTCPGKPVDQAYLDRLQQWLAGLGREAMAAAHPGAVATGRGGARIGYNRRCCWADGTHTMHGDTRRPDFTGLEGGSDPQHSALAAYGPEGDVRAILYHNTAHTTTFYGADFLSADYPGLARSYFRELFGPIPVLFFNGAIGDIALESQLVDRSRREKREQKMARAAHLIVGETLRLLHECEPASDPALQHVSETMEVSVRMPSPERLAWARACLAEAETSGRLDLEVATAYGTVELYERFHRVPRETISLHAGRVGDMAFATAPCELFSHFAARIMDRSPFAHTCLFGLTNGDMGYCPTMEAMLGGHWGGDPTLFARWEAETGYRLVDAAARMLCGLAASGG